MPCLRCLTTSAWRHRSLCGFRGARCLARWDYRISWFGTHPEYKGQNLGKCLLVWLEDNILIRELKAPAYSLGTSTSHPWLREMYIKLGFQPVFETDLGKGHITLYLKKILDEQRHALWLARQPV